MRRTYDEESRQVLVSLFKNAAKLVKNGSISNPSGLGQICGWIKRVAVMIEMQESYDMDEIETWFEEAALMPNLAYGELLFKGTDLVAADVDKFQSLSFRHLDTTDAVAESA